MPKVAIGDRVEDPENAHPAIGARRRYARADGSLIGER